MSILCLAEIVVDWLSFEPGRSFHSATQWYRAMGGNSANVAIGIGRLGLPVRLIGKIGNDLPGEFLRQALESESVDCSYLVVDPVAPTAQCYMTTSSDGEHHYYNWPQPHAADLLRSDEIPVDELFRDTTAVHTTSISLLSEPRRSAVMHVLTKASSLGVIVSFDCGFSKKESVRTYSEQVMRLADIVKMNEPELLAWARHLRLLDASHDFDPTCEEQTKQLARQMFEEVKPKALFVTLSARGSLVLTADFTIKCAPHRIESKSEVGAGDAYVAGALYMLTDKLLVKTSDDLCRVDEKSWIQVGRGGNIAGALAATHHSAYGGMPTADEFAKILGQSRV